jgi:hypothetical protein
MFYYVWNVIVLKKNSIIVIGYSFCVFCLWSSKYLLPQIDNYHWKATNKEVDIKFQVYKEGNIVADNK